MPENNTAGTQTGTPPAEQTQRQTPATPPAAIFTQEQVTGIAAKEASKAGAKVTNTLYAKLGVTDEAGFNAVIETLNASRAAAEQAAKEAPEIDRLRTEAGAVPALKAEIAAQKAALAAYELKEAISAKGATGKDAKLAAYEIGALITGGKDVATAIDEYFTANPTTPPNAQQPPPPPAGTGAGLPLFVPAGAPTATAPNEAEAIKEQFKAAAEKRNNSEMSRLVRLANAKNIILE